MKAAVVKGNSKVEIENFTISDVAPNELLIKMQSCGICGSDVEKVFNKMLEVNDRPVLVDCVVDPDDMVFPMVPAGGSNDQIIMNKEDLKNL